MYHISSVLNGCISLVEFRRLKGTHTPIVFIVYTNIIQCKQASEKLGSPGGMLAIPRAILYPCTSNWLCTGWDAYSVFGFPYSVFCSQEPKPVEQLLARQWQLTKPMPGAEVGLYSLIGSISINNN